MEADQLVMPTNLNVVYSGIKWLYSLTAARSWLIYKNISLHNKPFMDIMDQERGIDQFLYLWRCLYNGDLSEGFRVKLNGTLSEYAPLRPGITPLTIPNPEKWDDAF